MEEATITSQVLSRLCRIRVILAAAVEEEEVVLDTKPCRWRITLQWPCRLHRHRLFLVCQVVVEEVEVDTTRAIINHCRLCTSVTVVTTDSIRRVNRYRLLVTTTRFDPVAEAVTDASAEEDNKDNTVRVEEEVLIQLDPCIRLHLIQRTAL